MDKILFSAYQTANSDDYDTVKANFIVRKVEYDIIIGSLLDKTRKDSVQHELILGRRGSGKSTLLKRIEVELTENNQLKKKYIPVNLAEEQAGIYRLMDLWEQVLKELSSKLEIAPLMNFSEFADEQRYTRYLYQIIHETCAIYKKRIVLLLDNFDRIVENFTNDGNLLRETLINFSDLVIIGASTRMEEHFWQYDKPFYEFFRRHHLGALSSAETFQLFEYWSDSLGLPQIRRFIKNHPGKVENVRLLTDGLPRTMLFFIEIVLRNENPVNVDFLKKIMDEATPQYQERLNNLTPPMRKIILEMALIWEACTTKKLVEKCKMESKLISANLKTLSAKNVIEIIETDKRNHLYRISERFFNIWLIVTQGDTGKKSKISWLSIFLENWYDKNEPQEFIQQYTYKEIEKAPNIVSDVSVEYIVRGKNKSTSFENKNEETLWNLSLEQYYRNINKENVKQYINQCKGYKTFSIIIEIWTGIFENVENRVISAFRETTDNQSLFIERLLIHHQKSLVDKLFNHPEFGQKLQEQYTVLYYVSQILNNKEDNNLRLRIPPELNSTINNVIEGIKAAQEYYG
jgi:hypothetical protein